MFTVGLLGCSNTDMNNENKSTPGSTAIINDTTNKGVDNKAANANSDTEPSEEENSFSKAFIPDLENIKKIMNLKKEQVIEILGDDYETVNTGAELSEEGYNYKEYGMTIVFDDFLFPGMISYIECNEKVDIKGARLGMSFEEIINILGEGESREPGPEQPVYALYYKYDDIIVWFGGSDKEGAHTTLEIRRNNM